MTLSDRHWLLGWCCWSTWIILHLMYQFDRVIDTGHPHFCLTGAYWPTHVTAAHGPFSVINVRYLGCFKDEDKCVCGARKKSRPHMVDCPKLWEYYGSYIGNMSFYSQREFPTGSVRSLEWRLPMAGERSVLTLIADHTFWRCLRAWVHAFKTWHKVPPGDSSERAVIVHITWIIPVHIGEARQSLLLLLGIYSRLFWLQQKLLKIILLRPASFGLTEPTIIIVSFMSASEWGMLYLLTESFIVV